MSGGVLTSRLVLATVKALSKLEDPPTSAIILLDSMCTISSLEVSAKKLKPFFHNRRGEMLENMELVSELCTMEDVHHVPGKLNPADIATRGSTKIEDIGPGSLWQTGPTFLSTPRDCWPVTREFVRVQLPDEELRHPKQMATAAYRAVVVKSDHSPSSTLPVKHQVITQLLMQNNSLESRKRVLALVIRGWKHGQVLEVLKSPLTQQELIDAERIILASAMFETSVAVHKGQVVSLLPERKGSLIVTRGRLGEKSLERVFGVSALPILMADTRAAELVMWRAHQGYSGIFHRSVAQTLAKSRNSAWIVKGKNLAKKICFQCMECRRERKKLASQQMALFREESLQFCRPWTNISWPSQD